MNAICIMLKSDLCSSSGDGFSGVVDTDIVFDEQGIPYVPAKRFKGCLRECALEAVSVSSEYAAAYKSLFGVAGAASSGSLKLGDGLLYSEEYGLVSGNQDVSKTLERHTTLRSRTRIESGKAAEGSLRTMRVAKKGLRFAFPIELNQNDDKERELLSICCDTLRHIGLNRTRGLGEIACRWDEGFSGFGSGEANAEVPALSTPSIFDETHSAVSYEIYLDAPVISAGRTGVANACEDYIFGSAILGCFAAKWIEKHPEYRANAHESEEFRRLFLDGAVIFTAAFPSLEGVSYFPAPLTLRTDKAKTRLADSSARDEKSESDTPIASKLGGFVSISETDSSFTVSQYDVQKSVAIHHSRPADKKFGRAGGKSAEDGQIFGYEALSKGQSFKGSIIGSATDIAILEELAADFTTSFYIGRSRTAQYGRVKMAAAKSSEYTADPIKIAPGGSFRVVVRTPLVLTNENGTDIPDAMLLAKEIGAEEQWIRAVYCDETVAAGYNARQRLPRRQLRAIAEGSVVVFANDSEELVQLASTQFVGLRTDSGFGQIETELLFDKRYEFAKTITKQNAVPEKREAGQIALDSIDDYASGKLGLAPANAQLAGISEALGQAENYEQFSKRLMGIKQRAPQTQAYVFFTNTPENWFETHIVGQGELVSKMKALASKRFGGEEFAKYQESMLACIIRIKQLRRKQKVGE